MKYPRGRTKIILGLQSTGDGIQSAIGFEITKYDRAR